MRLAYASDIAVAAIMLADCGQNADTAASNTAAASIPDLSGLWAREFIGFDPPESGPGPITNLVRIPTGQATRRSGWRLQDPPAQARGGGNFEKAAAKCSKPAKTFRSPQTNARRSRCLTSCMRSKSHCSSRNMRSSSCISTRLRRVISG